MSSTAQYLTRDEIAAYIGQDVTIMRHPAPGVDKPGLLVGTLRAVGNRGPGGILPGRMSGEHGDTSVDLGCVLNIRPAAPATVRDIRRRKEARHAR